MKKILLALLLLTTPALAARTVVPITTVTHSGVLLAFIAADTVNGNAFGPNDGRTALVVNNNGVSTITVTIRTNFFEDGTATSGLRVPDRTATLNAGQTGIIGPFPPSIYTQADGTIWVDVSGPCGLMLIQIIPAQ